MGQCRYRYHLGGQNLVMFFYVHICPVHYLSHDRPLKLAAFMWLSSIFNILFSKNSIFVFFDDFHIIFKLRPSSMTVLIKYNCSNTSWYPFELYVSISLKKCSNCDKFVQKFLPFHRQLVCWSLRCSWSIACRHCTNYIFIFDLIPVFNRLHKGNCKIIWETFKVWGLVRLILEIWQ